MSERLVGIVWEESPRYELLLRMLPASLPETKPDLDLLSVV
jgi:hypothetical protein